MEIVLSKLNGMDGCHEHSLYDTYTECEVDIKSFNDDIKLIDWSSPNIFIHIRDDGFIPEDDIINITKEHILKYNEVYKFVRHDNHICTDILLKRWEMCKKSDEHTYVYYNRLTQDMYVHNDYFHYSIDRLKFDENSKDITDIYRNNIATCFPINCADIDENGKNFYFNTPSCLHFQLAPPEKICDFDALPTQAKRVNQHNRIYCKFLSKVINGNFEERGYSDGKIIYLALKRYLKTHDTSIFDKCYFAIRPCCGYVECVACKFEEPTEEDEEDFDFILHPAYLRNWLKQIQH